MLIVAVVLAAAVVLRLRVGGSLDGLDAEVREQVMQLRFNRLFVAGVVGGALAAAGVLLQVLLRNPLASPDILGPASGASLAVMIATWLGGTAASSAGFGLLAWQAGPALAGAMLTLGLVYALGQRRGAVEPTGLVIVGVVISLMCGAGVMFVQHMINASTLGGRTVMLLVGSITDDTPLVLARGVGVAVLLVVGVCAVMLGRGLDVMTLSDDESRALGLRLGATRGVLFVASGVLTAGAVVLAGPVGFVGLICPHAVRLMLGQGGRADAVERAVGRAGVALIGSTLAGAALLILADAGVRAIDLGAGRMPLGVLTALMGGPLLIGLLRRRGAV